jgi:hypothetical protein
MGGFEHLCVYKPLFVLSDYTKRREKFHKIFRKFCLNSQWGQNGLSGAEKRRSGSPRRRLKTGPPHPGFSVARACAAQLLYFIFFLLFFI